MDELTGLTCGVSFVNIDDNPISTANERTNIPINKYSKESMGITNKQQFVLQVSVTWHLHYHQVGKVSTTIWTSLMFENEENEMHLCLLRQPNRHMKFIHWPDHVEWKIYDEQRKKEREREECVFMCVEESESTSCHKRVSSFDGKHSLDIFVFGRFVKVPP